MNYSASVDAYSYNGMKQDNVDVSISLFNYSIAALVSPVGAEHFPVHLDAKLGGSLNLVYPVVIASLAVFLISVAFLKRIKAVKVVER